MGRKQAVVVIHGMGEQRPMGTLRSFVESVWQRDVSQRRMNGENPYWIKPDSRAGLKELRRITTGGNSKGVRTDFYEFYWADIMQGTTLQHLTSWLKGLLLRGPKSVPWNVFPVWISLWIFTLSAILLGLNSLKALGNPLERYCDKNENALICILDNWAMNGAAGRYEIPDGVNLVLGLILFAVILLKLPKASFKLVRTWLTLPIFAVVVVLLVQLVDLIFYSGLWGLVLSSLSVVLVHSFLVPYFGDVARYVEASPANIQRRQAVQERGLQLLRNLHQNDDYERVIVVSHSLGTIIAYDLLNMFWAENGPSRNNPYSKDTEKAFASLDDWLNKNRNGDFDLELFRKHQRRISKTLSNSQAATNGQAPKQRSPWRITDFVTLGSPLTHAEFLLARDEQEFEKLCEERVISKSPPLQEAVFGQNRYSFLFQSEKKQLFYPNHAAVFSAVRWTNIYDEHNLIAFLLGDVISGSLAENFGKGIAEDNVRIWRGSLGIPRLFTHTKYWEWHKGWDNENPPDHIQRLRNAVNLLDN